MAATCRATLVELARRMLGRLRATGRKSDARQN
jgi:hypothetical protein